MQPWPRRERGSKVQGRFPGYFVPRGIGPSQSEAAARSKGKIVRKSGAAGDEPLRCARAEPLALCVPALPIDKMVN